MMTNTKTQLQIIESREVLGKDFKIYGDIENPLFLAKDVAEWIDYSKDSKGNYRLYKMVEMVDEDEKIKHLVSPTNGGVSLNGVRNTQEMWFLTEDGLYEVLMQSRKPIAKEFKKQVKAILKQIRTTGGVVVEDREEEFINNYFPSFSEDVKLAMVQDLRRQNDIIKKQLQEQKPKVEYYDAVLDSSKLLTVTDIAQDLGITPHQLNSYLAFKKIQNRQYKQWKISKAYLWLIDEGYADYEIYSRGYGRTNQMLKWTEKGRKWIIENYTKDEQLYFERHGM